MKKIISFAIALLLLCGMSLTALAADTYVSDGADILSDSEERSLSATLAEISETYGAQITVITEQSLPGSIDYYINNLYDSGRYGYGSDNAGVMLLICMDTREYRILSNGFAADAITDFDIENISDAIVDYLSDGNYAAAFDTYAAECEYYLDGYLNGYPFEFSTNLIIALVVGFVIAFIVTSVLKGQLKSVQRQNQANAYVKSGSMKITHASDYYMYRTVTRSARPKNNSSSSSSSSGSSRNVGGGRF